MQKCVQAACHVQSLLCGASSQAATQKARTMLTKDEMRAMRQANDPNFKAAADAKKAKGMWTACACMGPT